MLRINTELGPEALSRALKIQYEFSYLKPSKQHLLLHSDKYTDLKQNNFILVNIVFIFYLFYFHAGKKIRYLESSQEILSKIERDLPPKPQHSSIKDSHF